jgi:hypothetical protein
MFAPFWARLLQRYISVPEAISLRRLQHIYTSLQSCCVGHIPRDDDCLLLCPTHHSANRKRDWWFRRNTAIVFEWLMLHNYWNHLPRRLVFQHRFDIQYQRKMYVMLTFCLFQLHKLRNVRQKYYTNSEFEILQMKGLETHLKYCLIMSLSCLRKITKCRSQNKSSWLLAETRPKSPLTYGENHSTTLVPCVSH